MSESQPCLSDILEAETILEAPSSRRAFLARASALSLAIPGVGAALVACSPDSAPRGDGSNRTSTERGTASEAAQDSLRQSQLR